MSNINGQTLNDILDDGSKQEIQRKVLLKTILFSLGFSLIFISLGATASLIGQSFLKGSNELRWISGLIVIFFSLHMMRLINLKFSLWKMEHSFTNIANFSNDWVFPVIIGVAFAFGCKDPGDIRLHYFAAKEYVKNRRTGSIFKVLTTLPLA